METNVIWRNARAAVIELDDGGYFTCADTWEIFVNDEPAGTTNTVETYVDGLTPGKRNLVRFVCGERELSVGVTTPAEPFTINVRDCGAKGDAEHDDTTNIQAAIMACPKGGRVLIPAGNYRIKSLFLKSNINIELAEGAVLLARHDRAALAYIPGTVKGDEGAGYAGTDMLPLGRWEGESFSTYCSTLRVWACTTCASMVVVPSTVRPILPRTTGGTRTLRTSFAPRRAARSPARA